LDDEEMAELTAAAGLAGLTLAGFVADSALAAARGGSAPVSQQKRTELLELMAARGVLGRIGSLLNQLTAAANSGADLPAGELAAVLQRVVVAAQRVERAAADVSRRR
jgi:hypothetical protein